MKFVKLTCPNCGATLEVKDKMAFCSYCGEKLMVDDESVNINYTYTKRDEARIRENERKERVRLTELDNDQKDKKRDVKVGLIGIGLLLFIMFFSIAMSFYYENASKPKDNEISMPASSSDYKGDNYEQVVQELEDVGFTNIETQQQKDLVLGWITKDGTVAKVSINGDTDFDEGDIFPKDSIVVVTYHTFD